LDRQETFSFNKETQLFPIAGLVAAELKRQEDLKSGTSEKTAEEVTDEDDFAPLKVITQRHHSHIVELIAEEASAKVEDIVDFELVLYDTQKACLGGLMNEFIFSARLDNLNQTYCATIGLIDSVSKSSALEDETSMRLIACFDHEEIGSMTAQGAFSMMLPAILRRLSVLPAASFSDVDSEESYDKANDHELSTAYEQTLASSFLVSADMAHSVNPNYAGKYETDHKPEMNKGPVIKINANARYVTNSPGIVLLQEVARKAAKIAEDDPQGVPLQLFVVRNDSSCGSTIGPMLSSHLGARTLDLGNPQLSMHSIRETGGTEDVHHAIRLFSSFFQRYSSLEKNILVD
jgi:aspartyl aminopeptidase